MADSLTAQSPTEFIERLQQDSLEALAKPGRARNETGNGSRSFFGRFSVEAAEKGSGGVDLRKSTGNVVKHFLFVVPPSGGILDPNDSP